MNNKIKPKNLDEIVKEIIEEAAKTNPKVITNGSGVGLNLAHPDVKNALLKQIKNQK